jgi:hypothetical protein
MNELTRTQASSFDYRNLLFIIFAFGFAAFTVLASYFGLTYLYDPDYIVLFVALIIGVGISLVGEIIFAVSINKKKAMGAYLRLCAWSPLVVVGSMAFGVILTYLVSKYAFTTLPEAAQGHQIYYFAALFVGAVVSMIPTLICIRPENKPVQVVPRNGFAKFINGALPWFLVIYTALVILPWMAHPSQSLFDLLNYSSVASFYRYGVAGCFLFYMVLIVIANKKLPSLADLLLFCIIILYLLVLVFVLPRDSSISSINKVEVSISLTLKESFSFFLRTAFVIAYSYSLIYVIPLAGSPRKTRNVLAYFVILFCLACIAYSFYAEKQKMVLLFSGEMIDKYAESMSSFFESKNGLGDIFFGGVIFSLVLAGDKRGLVRFVFALLSLFFAACCLLIRCDTAFVSALVVYFVFTVALLIHNIKNQHIIPTVLLVLVFLIFAAFLACIFVPKIYESVYFFSLLNGMFQQAFIRGRTYLWSAYFDTIDSFTSFFGQGLLGTYSIMMRLDGTIFPFPMHNGYLNLFNQGGIIFLGFYGYLLFVLFKNLAYIKKTNWSVYLVVLSSAIGFMCYSLAESIVLTLDSSLMSLFPTLLLVIAPTFYSQPKEDISI